MRSIARVFARISQRRGLPRLDGKKAESFYPFNWTFACRCANPCAMSDSFFETQDGAKLYYEDRGKGDVLVLVHGWMCSSRFWQANVPDLAKAVRVVTIDFRGHGFSSKTLSGHTVPQYARDVRAVIERLDLKNVTLAGWSLGGAVVLSYWQQYADDHRLKGF